MTSALMVLVAAAGLAPADMADVVAQRLAALDKLVLDVTEEVYGAHSDTPVLDRAPWKLIATFPYRLAILRPNVRVEALKDDPQAGYKPVVASVFDGTYSARLVRPPPHGGKWVYTVVPQARQAGVLLAHPLLQAFDLGIYDCPPPGDLDIVSVLRHPSATVVRSIGGISTYAVSVPTPYYAMHFELDLNEEGLPLRVKSALEYPDPNIPPTYYEQFILQTTEVNGADLPIEIAITHWGAKMPHYWNVWLYRVDNIELRNDLSIDDVRVEVKRRNSVVNEYLPDGAARQTVYDENGDEIEAQSFFHAADAETGDPAAIARAVRSRKGIGPAAAAVGVSTALALAYVARRGRH